MDFDFEEFSMWIKDIKPGIVELGADNYGNHLPEPSWDKVELLLNHLNDMHSQAKGRIVEITNVILLVG